MKEPYVFVRVGKRKYVREHILVMEKKLGHPIPKGYNVHHINGNTKDNRPENLELYTIGEHRRLHAAIRRAQGEYLTKEEKAERARRRAAAYREKNRDEGNAKQRERYYQNRDAVLAEKRKWRETHKEHIAKSGKEYREKHKEEIKERNRRYRLTHKKEIQERGRTYRQEHLDEIREKKKAYAQTHKEEIARRLKEYREKNKQQIAERRKIKLASRTPEEVEKAKAYHRAYYLKHKNVPKSQRKEN